MAVRNQAVVVCDGEWDISRRDEFSRLGAEALAASPGLLLLDFRSAAFAEATIVGAICVLAQEAARRGVLVAVLCEGGIVQRLFELSHLSDLVPVATTVPGALSMFGDVADAGPPGNVDEASEESFPASDPPSFGSAEPAGGGSIDPIRE